MSSTKDAPGSPPVVDQLLIPKPSQATSVEASSGTGEAASGTGDDMSAGSSSGAASWGGWAELENDPVLCSPRPLHCAY